LGEDDEDENAVGEAMDLESDEEEVEKVEEE